MTWTQGTYDSIHSGDHKNGCYGDIGIPSQGLLNKYWPGVHVYLNKKLYQILNLKPIK